MAWSAFNLLVQVDITVTACKGIEPCQPAAFLVPALRERERESMSTNPLLTDTRPPLKITIYFRCRFAWNTNTIVFVSYPPSLPLVLGCNDANSSTTFCQWH